MQISGSVQVVGSNAHVKKDTRSVKNSAPASRSVGPIRPPETRPVIHKAASSSYSAQKCLKFVMYSLLITASGASVTRHGREFSASCDSTAVTGFDLGLHTQINSTESLLVLPPNAYTSKIADSNTTLARQLSELSTMMDDCIATPSGSGQFTALQTCSNSLFSSVNGFLSPLQSLKTDLATLFNGNYGTVAATSTPIVPYTESSFWPLMGPNGLYESAKAAYQVGCGLAYVGVPLSNQTVAAKTANQAFLTRLDTGFDSVETVLGANTLGFSAEFVADMDGCRSVGSSSGIISCLTEADAMLTMEKNRLYGIVEQVDDLVIGLPTKATELSQFANSAVQAYQAGCNNIADINAAAVNCGYVPPTPSPTPDPSAPPTNPPTGSPTDSAVQILSVEVEKDDCVGMKASVFGSLTTLAGTLLGLVVGAVGMRKYDTYQAQKALEKEAQDAHPDLAEDEDMTVKETEPYGHISREVVRNNDDAVV